jgi:hypothetical protein
VSSGARFVVLCEDKQSQVFIYRALVARGVNRREIHKEPLPSESGGGAGDAFILAKYPDQVRAFRTRVARAGTGLVVHVDADPLETVADRHDQLAAKLDEAGQPRRRPGEAIAELIPKRNIETWIYALDPDLAAELRQPLDEENECPKLRRNESACSRAAAAFAIHSRNGSMPPIVESIPSLADGLGEFRRLDGLF